MKRKRLLFFILVMSICAGFGLKGLVWNTWSNRDLIINGVFVKGDNYTPATQWFDALTQVRWKKFVQFSVSVDDAKKGYQVGAKIFNGAIYVENKINYSENFAMRLGREDCRFFAINRNGKEIKVLLVKIASYKELAHEDINIH